jgi:hypothetical protein
VSTHTEVPGRRTGLTLLLRIGVSVFLAVSGYIHADLYIHGYRVISGIGPSFLLQAAASFALAALMLISTAGILRLGAVALSLGALGGFVLSRTVGLFGFVERGFDPAPQALISLLAEVAALALLAALHRSGRHRLGVGERASRPATT